MAKRQRTTFAKNQREKARMEKAAAKRARRQARPQESDLAGPMAEIPVVDLREPAEQDTTEGS